MTNKLDNIENLYLLMHHYDGGIDTRIFECNTLPNDEDETELMKVVQQCGIDYVPGEMEEIFISELNTANIIKVSL